MKKYPIVSIIVPVYNTQEFLEECIESILGQTYKNIELILIDDGSTDSSGEICDRYKKKDERIQVIHKENGGNTSARKAGLALAKGKYVGFVDSDDWIDENMYEQLVGVMEESQVDMVCSGYCVYPDGEKNVYEVLSDGIYTKGDNYEEVIQVLIGRVSDQRGGLIHNLWCKMFKIMLIKEVMGTLDDNIQVGEDWLGVCKAVLRADSVRVMNKAFYHYRMNENSITHKRDKNFFSKINELYNGFREEIEKYPDYFDTLSKQLAYEMVKFLLEGVNSRFDYGFDENVSVPEYKIPIDLWTTDIKVILCGAGKVGRAYFEEIKGSKKYSLTAWVDSNAQAYVNSVEKIYPIEYIKKVEYDVIILGALREKTAEDMKKSLKAAGAVEDKILWSKPNTVISGEINTK